MRVYLKISRAIGGAMQSSWADLNDMGNLRHLSTVSKLISYFGFALSAGLLFGRGGAPVYQLIFRTYTPAGYSYWGLDDLNQRVARPFQRAPVRSTRSCELRALF